MLEERGKMIMRGGERMDGDMDDIDKKYDWVKWKPFPNPKRNDFIYAPFGFGVYQLRNKVTGQYILFGEGKNLAYRMSSLLPSQYGQGTRGNKDKRNYVWKNIAEVEYRTVACRSKTEAQSIQKELKRMNIHRFNK
jgi:hypothetical protein